MGFLRDESRLNEGMVNEGTHTLVRMNTLVTEPRCLSAIIAESGA